MAAIKALERIREKWVRRAGQAGPDYEEGVRTTPKDWAANAGAAEGNYRDAVTRAATEGRFGRGVSRVGTQKWRRRSLELGTVRFGPGVAAAAEDFSRGFAPIREAIAAVTLPPRRPRRDPANLQRVSAVVNAVVAAAQARDRGTR
ncbi:MAG: hypothetical protein ACE5KQ_04700 [Thermoplasmata archaeon]